MNSIIKNTMTIEELRRLGVLPPRDTKPNTMTLEEYRAIMNGTKNQKYHNIKARCLLGHTHDSKAEARYCNILICRQRAGQIKEYEIQVPYSLHVEGKEVCKHYVDFRVYFNDGTHQLHEVKGGKGTMNAVWRLKCKMLKAEYKNETYVIIDKVPK